MKCIYNNCEIVVKVINRDLLNQLETSGADIICLFDNYDEDYLLVEIQNQKNSETKIFYYGSLTNLTLDVMTVFSKIGNSVLIGFDNRLVCLEVGSKNYQEAIFSKTFLSPVMSIIENFSNKTFTIITEIQIININEVGEVTWKKDLESIKDFEIHDDILKVEFYNKLSFKCNVALG